MTKLITPFIGCVVTLLLLLLSMTQASAQTPVEVVVKSGEYQLLRDGVPYQINGVGGDQYLSELKAAGGNSIRTWSVENLGDILDQAHQHDLTVCAGFWLGHERHGFDYQNDSAVRNQLESCLAAVEKYKNHPALLLWAVGNEMEGDGKNPAIWYAINHIARECKRLDPHHPTMTVIAELGENEVKLENLARYCPDVDIVGVNSYAGITSLAERYLKTGVTKPFIVTEHGPHGPWEVEKTKWGAPLEPSSTIKAQQYRDGYRAAVAQQPGQCFGSYTFLWGHKQETTWTWFGMLLPDGRQLGTVDVMSEFWTGNAPSNLAPVIKSLSLSGADKVKPGETLTAKVVANDPDGDEIKIEWVLRSDAIVIGVGGDAQSAELTFSELVKSNGSTASVTAPKGGGGYRLYAYVNDGNKKTAVANVPFYVDAPLVAVPSPQATLPLIVYGEGESESSYIPAGFMGKTDAIELTFDSKLSPHGGKKCLKVSYQATDEWGGVLWQSPPQDWDGHKPGGYNLGSAVAVEFWARGEQGGEVVNFLIGGDGGKNLYQDTAIANLKDVRLAHEWQKYRIPLKGLDLSRIKTGFGWSLAGQQKPVTFYLDDIRYVGEE